MIQQAIEELVEGRDLSPEEVGETVREIADSRATPAQVGAFLAALRQKGETPAELAAFASTLREYSVRISPRVRGRLVDTCGTGGDRVKTFNVSTLSAVVAAGAGASVAKHGNRSVTSKCGSADLLERLGFNLDMKPEAVKASIEEIGLGFMFAPTFHPAMKAVGPVRRELGVRTIFNLMGPLLNPAGASAQVVGVYDPGLVAKVAEALGRSGVQEAMVVHGLEGMDEISIEGETAVARLRGGEVKVGSLSPQDFGIQKTKVPVGEVQSVEDGARVAIEVLGGGMRGSPTEKMVLVNSAAALVVGGLADDVGDAMDLARASLEGGEALKKLRQLVEASGGDSSRVEVYAASS
ncbi:MAG: anthranilate phosphoribosyltransferase [archaeon]|nr:MAG: anthranilate phosphoribosyltransferase [archaeon]